MKHKEIIQAWLNGETVEYLSSNDVGVWVSLDPIETRSMMPAFSDNNTYRIKPKTTFVFFHTQKLYKNNEPTDIAEINSWVFNYPKYKPAGPHIMIELNSDREVISTQFSPDKSVNKTFTKEI